MSGRTSPRVVHLIKRAFGSFSNAPVSPDEQATARAVLTPAEFAIWAHMPARDQRHSIQVLRRFDVLLPEAARTARAAALLHDVGKVDSGLGWTMRILATVIGPRGTRFARYHDHERIGAAMLRPVSEHETVALVVGESADERALSALRAADDL